MQIGLRFVICLNNQFSHLVRANVIEIRIMCSYRDLWNRHWPMTFTTLFIKSIYSFVLHLPPSWQINSSIFTNYIATLLIMNIINVLQNEYLIALSKIFTSYFTCIVVQIFSFSNAFEVQYKKWIMT